MEALGHPPPLISPPIASRADVLAVHGEELVSQVEAASQGMPLANVQAFGLDTGDVPVFAGMDEASRYLVGGTLHAARLITSDESRRVLQLGGGLHHAQRLLSSGFCVYNDLAVAIHHLRQQGLRVAYLDIDVHHGDGVQWLFYDDPDVLTTSLHESGRYLYPGTGGVQELGKDDGKGFSINVPLEPYTHDASYLDAFERVVPHTLSRIHPEVLVVQCGSDAHASDPLAHLLLTTHTYEKLFRRILQLADEHTEGRVLLTLGGGYDLDATVRVWTMLYLIAQNVELPEQLPDIWLQQWETRLNTSLTPTLHDAESNLAVPHHETIAEHNEKVSKQVLELAAPYWY